LSNSLRVYFSALLVGTIIPYLPYILTFIPSQIGGFNLVGWSWISLLFISMIYLPRITSFSFPVKFWVPWLLYIIVYLVTEFSFLGFQLTLQYSLPVLIGLVASGFTYTEEDLIWMFKLFLRVCVIIFLMFLIGYFFRGGYGPSAASTAMLFSLAISLLTALWFITRSMKYLALMAVLFLASVIQVTRMGIAVSAVIFSVHFANENLKTKITYGLIGVGILYLVFTSKSFQEKTFYGNEGKLSDLSFNYYENKKIRSSGRQTWRKALQPGLEAQPVWGNGPRADIIPLTRINKRRYGEAHNDYLSIRYNYGFVGLFLLLGGFAMNFVSIFNIFRKNKDNITVFILSSVVLTLFISFLMFMYSDNILKYTIYFPNYFFFIIGMIYAIKRDEYLSSNTAV
jgi:O-antigen ligase